MSVFNRNKIGIDVFVVFFAAGTCMATFTALALLLPGGPFDAVWLIKPEAHNDFLAMGGWAVPLLATIALGCLLAAIGLWHRRRWGQRLAVIILAMNMLGDLGNTLLRGDLRTLIGIPVAGLMLWYLLSRQVHDRFEN